MALHVRPGRMNVNWAGDLDASTIIDADNAFLLNQNMATFPAANPNGDAATLAPTSGFRQPDLPPFNLLMERIRWAT